MTIRIDPRYTAASRKLRRDQTNVENLLWFHLKNRQLSDLKFRRQHKIDKYIVDFVCLDKMLIVELDGGQHNEAQHTQKDKLRDTHLNKKGYRVLRFWNNDVLQSLQSVLERIHQAALYPHPDPLPKREREPYDL